MEIFNENLDKISNLVYDSNEIDHSSYGGEEMTSKELLSAALRHTDNSQAEAAAKIGWVPQQLSQRLVRNSLRADEFLNLLEGIGVEVVLVNKADGTPIRIRVGRRVKGMVDRVNYDTDNAFPLANDFFADGVNEYTYGKARELYVDKEGRYFFAEYSNWEGTKDRIVPVSAQDAAAFIERFGTGLKKIPTE